MTRDELNKTKQQIIDTKEMAHDMGIVADKINRLAPGQAKRVLTDEVITIIGKYKAAGES